MKNIRDFLSENFQFLKVKFSIYLDRRVFVMTSNFLSNSIIVFTFREIRLESSA